MAKLVLIPGSLRKDSINKKLLEVCADYLKQKNVETIVVSQGDLNVPLINTDDEKTKYPATIKTIADQIAAADGVLVSTPEYNSGISAVLKNFIDWTSRLSPHPWKNKPVMLVGTSPGDFGALTGLYHTRDPFDRLNALVFTAIYALPHGDKVLVDRKITDPVRQKNLEGAIDGFLSSLKK